MIPVPESIASDGSREVTYELVDFFASVPDGSEIVFPEFGQYHVEGVVSILKKKNLKIHGRRSMLYAVSHGADFVSRDPKYTVRHRSHLRFDQCEEIMVDNLYIHGSYNGSGFRREFEAQNGIEVSACKVMIFCSMYVFAVWGDGKHVSDRSQHILFYDFHVTGTGRQGASNVDGDDVTIDEFVFDDIGRTAFDLEPLNNQTVRNTTIRNGRCSRVKNSIIGGGGSGKILENTVVENVRAIGIPFTIKYGTDNRRSVGLEVKGCYSDTAGGGDAQITLKQVDDGHFDHNTIPVRPFKEDKGRIQDSGHVYELENCGLITIDPAVA